MRVRDLGPIVVEIDGREAVLRGSKPTTLLAVLAVNANRRVSVDTLIDVLWGAEASPGRASTLESHIWRLRQVLEPDRAPRQAWTVLLNDTGGYRLGVEPDDVDSVRFERLTEDGRRALAAGRVDQALDVLREALGLWRGEPYTPWADASWVQSSRARLSELRDQARELVVDAHLALGQHQQALSALDAAPAADHVAEHRHAQRMVALAALGRVDEARTVYSAAAEALLDQLGVEPGPELRQVAERLKDPPPTPEPTTPARIAASPLRSTLPRRLSPIIGREEEMEQLTQLVPESRLCTVVGPAGTGKTRLATEMTRRLAAAFPDGAWLIDLAQIERADLVPEVALSTMGVAPAAGVTTRQALAAHLGDRHALLVLDNCEHLLPDLSETVAELLREDGVTSILATSREPLAISGELIYTLTPLELPVDGGDAVPDSPATRMFLARMRAADPTIQLQESDHRLVADICIQLDGLPLAIELAAARVRAFSLTEISEQLRRHPTRLSGPGHSGVTRSLDAEIDRSYQQLSTAERAAHRRLSVFPGPFTPAAAAAVLGADGAALELVPQLVNRSLLTATKPSRRGGATVFRQLETVRAHAVDRTAAAERGGALDRRDAWAYRLFDGFRMGAAEPELYRIVDDNLATLRAAMERGLAGDDPGPAALLAARASMYFYTRFRTVESGRWMRLALARSAELTPAVEVTVRAAHAANLVFADGVDAARRQLERIAELLPEVDVNDDVFLCQMVGSIGSPAVVANHFDFAAEAFAVAARFVDHCADEAYQVLRYASEWQMRASLGADPAELIPAAGEYFERAMAIPMPFAAAYAARTGAHAAMSVDDLTAALVWTRRAVVASGQYAIYPGGGSLDVHANLLATMGRRNEAITIWGASHAQSRRMSHDWPRNVRTRQLLDEAKAASDPQEFRTAWEAGAALDSASLIRLVEGEDAPVSPVT